MSGTAAVLLGLLALPHAFGYSVLYDGHHWHKFGAGFSPEMIHRHVYNMGEYCAKEGRTMYFGDEVLVMTQRPWEPIYAGGKQCTMNITGSDADVGILVTVLTADTPDCGDYMKIDRTTMNDPNEEMFCGPRTNLTGRTENYINETVFLRWNSIPRDTQKPAAGVKVLLTAFQQECKLRQACFPCSNGYIIDQVHMCNGFNNCGDNSDETGCPVDRHPTVLIPASASGLTAAFIICITLAIAVIGVLVYTTRKYYLKSERILRQANAEGEGLVDQNQQNQQV